MKTFLWTYSVQGVSCAVKEGDLTLVRLVEPLKESWRSAEAMHEDTVEAIAKLNRRVRTFVERKLR
jgi:hypothetical protein